MVTIYDNFWSRPEKDSRFVSSFCDRIPNLKLNFHLKQEMDLMDLQIRQRLSLKLKLKYPLSRPPCRIEFFIATQWKLGLQFHVVHIVVYDAMWLGI